MDNFSKNEKQFKFNEIKGVIIELNDAEKFCSVTLSVGHENIRNVNLTMKKNKFDEIKQLIEVGDKVCVFYYIVSRNKNQRWYTTANLLEIKKG